MKNDYSLLGMLSRGKFPSDLFLFVTLTKVRVQLGAVKLDSGFRRNDDNHNTVMRGLDPRICRWRKSAAVSFSLCLIFFRHPDESQGPALGGRKLDQRLSPE